MGSVCCCCSFGRKINFRVLFLAFLVLGLQFLVLHHHCALGIGDVSSPVSVSASLSDASSAAAMKELGQQKEQQLLRGIGLRPAMVSAERDKRKKKKSNSGKSGDQSDSGKSGDQSDGDLFSESKRRVPNCPDPLHNR